MKMKLECMECGKKFTTSSMDPECPKCGGVDYEVVGTVVPKAKVAKTPEPVKAPEPTWSGWDFDGYW